MSWIDAIAPYWVVVGVGYTVGAMTHDLSKDEHRDWYAEQFRKGFWQVVLFSVFLVLFCAVAALAWPVFACLGIMNFYRERAARRVFKAGKVDGRPCVLMRNAANEWCVYSFCPHGNARRLARKLERQHPEGSRYREPKP